MGLVVMVCLGNTQNLISNIQCNRGITNAIDFKEKSTVTSAFRTDTQFTDD